MARKIKLLKWEADAKKGEIRVEFENNWFLEGENVISNDGKIDLRIERYINDNMYMCSFHNLQREIQIGEEMEKANKIDLTSDGISTGKFKLTDEQLETFNDNQPNYIGDFIPNPNIITQPIPNELVWSNDAVVLPISVRLSDDGQRELTLYSDGSLSIKHINTNSLMICADTKIYEKMLIENNITNHKEDKEDEEFGEARELKLGEKEV